MKKAIAVVLLALLFVSCATAEVRLTGDAYGSDSSEYIYPLDNSVYYTEQSGDTVSVMRKAAGSGEISTAMVFTSNGASHSCARIDADGNVFILKHSADETAKSALLHVLLEGANAVVNEYAFNAATSALSPVSFDYSPYSSAGVIAMTLSDGAATYNVFSVLNVFWGAMSGYNELIAIKPGTLTAEKYDTAEMFDVYGYLSDGGKAFAEQIKSGEILAPTNLLLSPNGDMLLITVDYQGETLVYIMDIYTLDLELAYLPDGFSGTVSWNVLSGIDATSDSGELIEVQYKGFQGDDWSFDWDSGWADDENDAWSGDITDGWENAGEGSLDDWL